MKKTTVVDLVGKKFGRLLVIERDMDLLKKRVHWKCLCECGVSKSVDASNLKSGHTTSCGCYNREKVLETNLKHGNAVGGSGGGTRTYRSWQSMKARCYNPNNNRYAYYGKRGIQVCAEWKDSFENFLRDMGERDDSQTLERIDSNKDYCKENCRWATKKEQANNKTNNIIVEFYKDKITLKQLADILNVPYKTLHMRLMKGWSLEKALDTPFVPRDAAKNEFIKTLLQIEEESLTVEDWCLRYGISVKTAFRRFKEGWPLEQAVTKPTRKYG